MKLSFHQHIALFWMIGAPGVTFRRRQHEISKVDRTVFSDVGVASENGIYGHS
ncbi:integrase, partial [Klebsiella variicola]